jgi:hypothetical protein
MPLNNMINFFLDIETIPSQNYSIRDEFIADIKPPATHKKQETIDAWMKENQQIEGDAAWRKTSFDGALGHVCVIGFAIDDEPARELHIPNIDHMEAEILLLAAFSAEIDKVCKARPNERPRFIGHNLVEFDLKFLFQRSVVLNVKPSQQIPFNCKPWDDSVYDTLQKWGKKKDSNFGVSLDKISKACGLKGKGDIDGSMVWDYVASGRIVEVAEYCKDDVNMTRALFKRMTFL